MVVLQIVCCAFIPHLFFHFMLKTCCSIKSHYSISCLCHGIVAPIKLPCRFYCICLVDLFSFFKLFSLEFNFVHVIVCGGSTCQLSALCINPVHHCNMWYYLCYQYRMLLLLVATCTLWRYVYMCMVNAARHYGLCYWVDMKQKNVCSLMC